MSRIVEVPQPYNFDEIVATKGVGYKPDFRILTAGIESDRNNASLVHMIGSSTEKDLQGDTMSIYALQSMTKAAPNLTVWLNHNYDLPDSMFGSIVRTPSINHTAGVADLHLDVDVELENPHAARVKRYIDNGRRLGCSIGCMVTKYEILEDEAENIDTWEMPPIVIHDVYVVEYSVVGIPANQRSWVENAIRGVFQRTLDPALAPAMKGLWPTQYRDTLKAANGVISKAHLKQLEDAPARKRPDARIDWMTNTKNFIVTRGEVQKTLQRDEIETLLEKGVVDMTDALQMVPVQDFDAEEIKSGIPNEIDPQSPGMEGEPDHNDGPYDDEHLVKLHTDGLNHDSFNGQHTHNHESFGYGPEPVHTHLHTHVNDNNHNHNNDIAMANEADKNMKPEKVAGIAPDSTETKAEDVLVTTPSLETDPVVEPEKVAEQPVIDPAKLQFLASYNAFGATLGLPEVTPEMLVRSEHPATSEKKIEESVVAQLQQAFADALTKALRGELTVKAEEVEPVIQIEAMKGLGNNLELFAKTFEKFDSFATKKDAEDAAALIGAVRKQASDLTAEIQKATTTLANIKNMPLGNPVHQSRSTHAEDNLATHADMAGIVESHKAAEPIAHDSLSQAFALTEVKSMPHGNGQTMTHRHWPDGIGGSIAKGVRPQLSAKQIQFMEWDDIVNYREGRAAKVPYLDNQVM